MNFRAYYAKRCKGEGDRETLPLVVSRAERERSAPRRRNSLVDGQQIQAQSQIKATDLCECSLLT